MTSAGVEVGTALLDATLLTVSAASEATATGGVQSNRISTEDVMTVFVDGWIHVNAF